MVPVTLIAMMSMKSKLLSLTAFQAVPTLVLQQSATDCQLQNHNSDDDDFLGNSPKKSLPSFFGDGIAGSSRPPFLPYSGEPVFDREPDQRDSRGSSNINGREPHKSLTGTPGFDFDEDDEEQIRERTSAASRASGKLKDKSSRMWDGIMQSLGLRRKIEVGGERTIYINDQAMNQQFKYCNNYVSTGKYNLVTFVPKFLAGVSSMRGVECKTTLITFADPPCSITEQFSKYANVFFLFTAAIMQIPGVSPTNRYTTILPLSIVLLVAAFKEVQEDFKRHQSDRELNARKAKVLAGNSFVDKPWRNIKVGDLVRLESNDFFPADLLLVSSSEPEGLCYIETSNLDGETNLKIKQANTATAEITSGQAASTLNGYLKSENPNNSLYTYEGTLNIGGKTIPLDPNQLLLRGAQLRNTEWIYGLVVFTGHETKLMRNAT